MQDLRNAKHIVKLVLLLVWFALFLGFAATKSTALTVPAFNESSWSNLIKNGSPSQNMLKRWLL